MLDMVCWPCGPGIELNVLSMVSLLSRLEWTVDTGVVGACEDSGASTPLGSGVAGLSTTVNIAGQRGQMAKAATREGTG